MRPNRLILLFAHLAGWLLFFSLVIGFVYRNPDSDGLPGLVFSGPFLLFGFMYLALFYLNTYLLVPRLYVPRRYLVYAGLILALFALYVWIRPFEGLMNSFDRPPGPFRPLPGFADRPGPMPMPPKPNRNLIQVDIISIVLFVAVWSLSTGLCLLRQWRLSEQRAVQAEADKANAELSFLKAQVNPHFLFNTLNNIYALAIARSEKTPESILKLSNIMRYVTDEIHGDFVALDDELGCLCDYIDLQRLRLGSKTSIEFSVTGETAGLRIVPLVLMTFVENAFKYGVSNHEPSIIRIKLEADASGIDFFCENPLFIQPRTVSRTGIGIENTRHRLHRLYPNRHQPHITTGSGFYTVRLQLQS